MQEVDSQMVFNITQHCFEENCNKDSKRTALIVVDENDKVQHDSYQKIYQSIHPCANFLSKKGLKKGDRILLRSEAGLQFVVLYFSAMAIGVLTSAYEGCRFNYKVDEVLMLSGRMCDD